MSMRLTYRAERFLNWLRRRRELRLPGPLGAFYRDGGDELLVSDLPLESGALVIDGGGYVGKWTDQMLCRYDVRVVVFEAVPAFAHVLARRYARNSRVEVNALALSNFAGRRGIGLSGESTSLFSAAVGDVTVQLIDAVTYFEERSFKEIDCLMLNIEGAEYDVLERIIESGWLARIKCLLVQFHAVVPEATKRRSEIQAALQATHRCVFDYPFVWERWDLQSIV